MKHLLIAVEDEWLDDVAADLRKNQRIKGIQEVLPSRGTSEDSPAKPRLTKWGPAGGVWDDPDFDFNAFRRQAWGRDV